jgi:hypothetical protein
MVFTSIKLNRDAPECFLSWLAGGITSASRSAQQRQFLRLSSELSEFLSESYEISRRDKSDGSNTQVSD